jgi:hypothetical protein
VELVLTILDLSGGDGGNKGGDNSKSGLHFSLINYYLIKSTAR